MKKYWDHRTSPSTYVIARLIGTTKTDLRYTKEGGLEIITSTSQKLLRLFRLNCKDNLAYIHSLEEISQDSLNALSYRTTPSNLAVRDF